MSGTGPRRYVFAVSPELDGSRLDRALAAEIPELSRRGARVALDLGAVFVDGRRVKVASRALRQGQTVEASLGGAFERATNKVGREARARDDRQLPPFTVCFEDDDVVVVDKPAGLLTAPTPEGDRGNLADLLKRQGREAVFVVHRLDLPTSGILVLAKNDMANRGLSELFRVHDVERRYEAVVAGAWPEEATEVTSPVGGKAAITHFAVLERYGEVATRLSAKLFTGRTHQIRRHAADLGFPVAGDRRYGRGVSMSPKAPRMALHAAHLGFRHPRTGELVHFDSALPQPLADWIDLLRQVAPHDSI